MGSKRENYDRYRITLLHDTNKGIRQLHINPKVKD